MARRKVAYVNGWGVIPTNNESRSFVKEAKKDSDFEESSE